MNSQPRRAITKSMSTKSQSFGASEASPSATTVAITNDPYTYSYDIWSSALTSVRSQAQSSWSSSSLDNTCNSTSSSSTASLSPTQSLDHLQPLCAASVATKMPLRASASDSSASGCNGGKRQLPSTKANVELIAKCIEKKKRYGDANKIVECSFCKNNSEPEFIYRSHALKDSIGRITCPLLKIYTCPMCGESGQNAHTLTYCKKFKTYQRTSILKS
jgi:hypothetical protein